MLVAKKAFEYTYEPMLAKPKAKESQGLCLKTKLGITMLIVCAFAIGLALTSRAALVTQKGYQIAKLEKEIQSLQTANDRLKLEIDQLNSLDRVEKIAINSLGMTKPAVEDMEFVPVKEKIVVASNAAQTKTTVQVRKTKPGTLAVISEKISSFFLEMVEASEL